jgi:predicted nucleic acid-binding protein
MKTHPDKRILEWIKTVKLSHQYLSILTIGELYKGISLLEKRGNAEYASKIGSWIEDLQVKYRSNILDIDLGVAKQWGQLAKIRTLPVADSLIAATALQHNLTLATLNYKDFKGLGIDLVDFE